MPERGGPTTQSGIYYQNSVAALYLGRLCDATQRPDSQRVVRVRVEAPTAVDDTVVTFADGGVTYIQAKENVRDSEASWADLWSDFETQFRRPEFSRGRDRLLLHTGEPHKEHHALRELCDRTAGRDGQDDSFARRATRVGGAGAAVLAIKADQQLSGIESPEVLRASLRLPDAVERVVARLAEAGDVVVMVDQIDALSLSMAHDQKALNVVLDLVARLRLIGGVRILVSCRTFDLNNDPSLRRLGVNKRFSIPELTEEEVRVVLEGTGGEFERLSPATQKLLRIPLHLDLFSLAMEYMNREQRTSAPLSVVTGTGDRELEKAATWLASEGILIPGAAEWSYLHQTFFDYCYAKEFAERGHSLSETVISGDQGIFARPQIVQVLGYLRGVSRQAYLRELNALPAAEPLRAHLKDLVFSWFGALPNPTDEEWLYARRMLADVKRRGRLLAAMAANPGWFPYLKDATIPSLLGREDETLDSLVIPYLIFMLSVEQAEVIKLVSPYLNRGERWNRRLNWMLRNVRQWKTWEAIDLFEQMCGALSPAEIKHLYQLDDVAKADPRVGCRLARIAFDKVLDDYLAARKGDERAYLFSLSSYLEQYNGSTMSKTLNTIAQKEPEYFLEQMLPWLDRVMGVTAEPDDTFPAQGLRGVRPAREDLGGLVLRL
jgi:hypothetical protein